MAGAVPGGMDWIYRATGMQPIQNPIGGPSAWMSTQPSYYPLQPQQSYGGSSYGGSASEPAPMSQYDLESLYGKYNAPTLPTPPQIPGPTPPTRTAGTAQAFARAKDISGRQGAAAIKSLKDAMSSRNMGDSGMEAELTGNILSDIARFNSTAAYNSALVDDDRTWEAAKLGFQGALGQRSTDMDFGLDQRGQDLSRTAQLLSLLGRRY